MRIPTAIAIVLAGLALAAPARADYWSNIEGTRYYAVDPWVHGLFLPIEQDMVIAQDIRQTGPGRFVGFDLPTKVKARYKLVESDLWPEADVRVGPRNEVSW